MKSLIKICSTTLLASLMPTRQVLICVKKGNQVVRLKGARVMYDYGNSDKSQITIMGACSSAAHFFTTHAYISRQTFQYNPLEGLEEAALGRSETGWFNSEVFNQWLEFIPGVEARNVKKPVLLLIDGHSSHVTLKASDTYVQHDMFGSLMKLWRRAVRNWQAENIGEYVTKVTFARVLKNAWEASTNAEVVKEVGLFTLNASVVTSSFKIETSNIFSQQKTETPVTNNLKDQKKPKPKLPRQANRKHKTQTTENQTDQKKTETQAAETTPEQSTASSRTERKKTPRKKINICYTLVNKSPKTNSATNKTKGALRLPLL